MLADAYVRPEHTPYTAPELLEPSRRRIALMDRLLSYAVRGTEVLCLQEIEPTSFAAAAEMLDAHGYQGRFLQKVGKPDGVAIFVRRSLGVPTFREVVYSDGTGHGALAAVVGGIGIATTHLKWESPDVPPEARLGRRELIELTEAFVRPSEPWIVTGDLNADASSPVLAVAFACGLQDAYASLPDACTCNSNSKRKRIDFILCSSDFVASPAPLPVITDVTPLPSTDEPSDHLPIEAGLTTRAL
jgi:exonuclease III